MELSPEDADPVAERIRRYPEKLPIVIATIPGLVRDLLTLLRRRDANCLVTAVGFDNPVRQIVSGVALRLVGQWLSAVREQLPLDAEQLSEPERLALAQLFEERPYRESARGSVGREMSADNTLRRVLARCGLKTAAQVRKGNFAILFHTCVTRFGISAADAVSLCGAKDMRSAVEKVCTVLRVPSLQHALGLNTNEAVYRGRRFIFESSSLPAGIPAPEMPAYVWDWLQNRTEQNRTEQNRTEQNRTEQHRPEQNRTEQNRTEQNRTEQNRTESPFRGAETGARIFT
jgi:hypothetical protein